jgi:hypothetical protein
MRLATTGKNASIHKTTPTLLLLLIVVLGGCGRLGENTQPASNNQPAPAGGSNPQSGGQVSTPTPAVPVAAPAGVVIATADGEKSGTRVEINELKRSSDGTVTLRFALVNDSTNSHSFGYDYGDSQQGATDYNAVGGVTLVDGANKKKYFVVRDSENHCLCSRGLKDITAGSRGNLWAKFPAPPEDVSKISIVIPHFGPIDDVPISR